MNYILPFIVGYIAAFVGLIAPSMLNMTAAKTSLDKGKAEGIKFAAGAATVVIVQAFIAVYFAEKITPEIITKLQTAAIFVLLALAVFFFMQARKKFKAEGKDKKGSSYIIGLGMSSLNMLAVPFYLGMAKVGEAKFGMSIEAPFSYIYVIGAVLGAFSLFSIYASFAEIIAKKAQFIAKNINYILAVLFVVLALASAYKVLTA
jgi:threonine/homoserine/homoserine lactone efflux protein